jgi:hypothetical protein
MKVNDFIFDSSGDLAFQSDIESVRRRILKKLSIPPEDLQAPIELPRGYNQQNFEGAKVTVTDKETGAVLLIGDYANGSLTNIRQWDETDCKHRNIQEALLLNFTVKHCKDCGREVK